MPDEDDGWVDLDELVSAADCWWVDFCTEDCPLVECHRAGRCAPLPRREIVDVPISGDVL